MAYPNIHGKLSWGGVIHGGEDIWTNSLSVGVVGAGVAFSPNDSGAVSYAEGARDALVEWFTSTDARISTAASINWVKLATLDEEGKYVSDPIVLDIEPGPTGSAGGPVAPQLTVALSTTTSIRRGPGKDGRIYPPLTGIPTFNGRDQYPAARRDAFIKLLNDLNALDAPGQGDVRVIHTSKVRGGVAAYVTGVRVGDVIDTQRRRRNKFEEQYAVGSLEG